MKPIFFKPRKGKAEGKIAPVLTACALAILTAACGQGRIIKVTPAPEAVAFSGPREADWKRADSLWELRRDPQTAWAALVSYRGAAEAQPRVPELWTRYAHACYFLATYTEQNQEWSNPERSRGVYLEGARAAENALRLNTEYREKVNEAGDETAALRTLSGPWLESAFWLAANQGRWALGEGRRTRMDGRDRLETFVRLIAARAGGIYHAGPDRFLGVMFLAAPDPRPDSARAYFDRAQARAPLFFGTRTLRAEYLAVFEKDSTSFRALLEEVLKMPADTLPEAAIENEYEQSRARLLLSRQAELFP